MRQVNFCFLLERDLFLSLTSDTHPTVIQTITSAEYYRTKEESLYTAAQPYEPGIFQIIDPQQPCTMVKTPLETAYTQCISGLDNQKGIPVLDSKLLAQIKNTPC